jgi:hypothetical protein
MKLHMTNQMRFTISDQMRVHIANQEMLANPKRVRIISSGKSIQ